MEEIETCAKLQNLLNNINKETYNETLKFILDLFHNQWINDYFYLILKYTEIRPNNSNFYYDLVDNLAKEENTLLFEALTHSQPRFLYFLFQKNNLNKELIQSYLNTTNSMEIAFLSILKHDNRVKQLLQHISYSRFLELKRNNYLKYNEILQYGYEKNSVPYAIKNDDVELLKTLYKENETYFLDELSQNPMKTAKFSPLALSIFYQSKNCRLFLETKEKYDESCYKMLVTIGELQNVNEEQIKQYKYYSLYYHTESSNFFTFSLEETVETSNYKAFSKIIQDIEKHKQNNKKIDQEYQYQINNALICSKKMDLTSFVLFLINFGDIDLNNFYDNLGQKVSFNAEDQPDRSELCLDASHSFEKPVQYSHAAQEKKKLSKKASFFLLIFIIAFVIIAIFLYYKYVIPLILTKLRQKGNHKPHRPTSLH